MMLNFKDDIDRASLKEKFWQYLNWDADCIGDCTLNESADEEAKAAFSTYKEVVRAQMEQMEKYRKLGFS